MQENPSKRLEQEKGCGFMNKIYKVIWNKTRGMYMVVSELAKSQSKGSGSVDKRRKLTQSAAALALFFSVVSAGGTAWAADTTTVTAKDGTEQTVYTQEGTDSKIEAAKKYTYRKAAELNQKLTDQKTSTALHVTKAGNLIVGTKENQIVQNLKINGQLTSESISTGDITSTGDVTVTGKMAADGVTDETTKDGAYIKQNNTVGNNLVSLDKQVKANADAITAEATARESKDNELNDRITNVKEYLEKQTSDTYVSKADAAVQDGAIVKAANTIGENVTNLDAALAKETAARIGADKAQDAVIQQVNQNAANGIATLATAYNNEVANREAADNELNERITNEANAIHETTNKLQDDLNTETTAREAADTALDTRITNVKEYLEKQTSDHYVSKADAAVQDGAIVKAANTIGENVTNLDAALAKETAARIGADKAQDKVIEQVNQNMVDGFNTINTNMANGFAALNAADAAEKEARIGADKKLAEAVNSGLSLSDDNVLQKNTTAVANDGTVTTSKSDAKEMILNKDKDNQITLNEKGIKVGTNSSVMDKDGVYTGGDTFDAAKAAMSSDGQIKGANGKFTVDASGNTSVTSLDAGTGTIQTKGDLYAKDATFSGDITAKDATLSGDLSAKDGTFSGDLSAKDGTFSGDVSAKDVTATGTLQGAEVTDGTATLKQGKLTGVKDIETEALYVNGDANVTGKLTTKDLEVTGEFNANTLKSRLDENNYTEIHGGNVTSKNLKVDKGVIRTSESSFDENGREEYVTDNDSRATVKVGANEISQTLDDKGDTSEKQSTFRQKIDQILQEIKSANGSTSVEQTDVNITNTAKNGTITNDAQNLVNKASGDMTNTVGGKMLNDVTGDLENKVGGNLIDTIMGTSTTTVTGKVTEDYKSDLSTKVGGDETHAVTGNQTTTVSGNRTVNVKGTETENFNALETNVKTDQKTSVGGNQTNIVGGDQQNTVSGSKNETVKGSVTEKYGSQATTVDGDQSTNIGGNQTTVVAKDQTNTVSGNKTETVKGAVNETYGSQTTKVNGDQNTTVTGKQTNSITGDQVNTIGGNQTTTVTGDSSLTAENITNEAKNKITNKALDVETDASSSIVSKVFNEYGSNTSTQLSYQTTEEMSQADGKKASYLRGAAEEKSQLTDGDKKTTIDTIAGQTNTNITDGTNTSNSLQKADQVASSVTDGTNTTVVNQDAKSIASSITDGTKANSTNSTVDKSEQLIKASDSQYNASVKTATASAERLVSGNIIDILKDAENGYVNTTVTSSDGASSTSVQQGNKDITNTAKQGTITNEAKNLVNKAEEKLSNSAAEIENTATTSIKDVVGKSTVTTTDTGTTFENSDHAAAIGEGSIIQTTISGNTLETGKATADYVDVNKDLHVMGNTKLDGTLEVAGKSTFKDAVSMEKDLSVGGNATVAGDVSASSYKVADKTYIDQNGINANSQKVTNVADGDVSEGSTDAVNGGQLHATNQRVSTVENRMDGVENRVDRVENRVDNLDNRIDKVGASAAAMANLHPMDFDEDSKVSVAAAVGTYRSETAGALGVFYRPTDRVMMNVSTSFGNGENMVGGGVSFKLGKSSKRLQQAEATNAALSKQVANLQNRLDALLGVLNPNLSKAFPDVPANHWAYEAVSRLAGNDIVQGYEDGKYHGERTMSRYEMAEIIYNALSKGAKAEAKLVEEFRPELQAMAAQRKA
jgi:hypothetical protein